MNSWEIIEAVLIRNLGFLISVIGTGVGLILWKSFNTFTELDCRLLIML